MSEAQRRWIGASIALALIGMAAIGGISSMAQDATPMTPGPGLYRLEHPAHIHAGNCETLDPNPLAPLASIIFAGSEAEDGDSPATPEMATPAAGSSMGSSTAIEAGHSTTNVPLALTDILAAEHAINVHLSPEQAEVYIACGTIGGEPRREWRPLHRPARAERLRGLRYRLAARQRRWGFDDCDDHGRGAAFGGVSGRRCHAGGGDTGGIAGRVSPGGNERRPCTGARRTTFAAPRRILR